MSSYKTRTKYPMQMPIDLSLEHHRAGICHHICNRCSCKFYRHLESWVHHGHLQLGMQNGREDGWWCWMLIINWSKLSQWQSVVEQTGHFLTCRNIVVQLYALSVQRWHCIRPYHCTIVTSTTTTTITIVIISHIWTECTEWQRGRERD